MLEETILLKNSNDEPISGLPNAGSTATGETAIDIDHNDLGTDDDGMDSEGLVALPDGTFWISDEYGPHIAHHDADGTEVGRVNPFTGRGSFAGVTLPEVYGFRRPNRGMEGLTYVSAADLGTGGVMTAAGVTLEEEDWLVGIMQSTMQNPTRRVDMSTDTAVDIRQSNVTRILFFPADPMSTSDPKEFLYVQQRAGNSNSEIRYLGGTEFIVLERDGAFGDDSNGKWLYKIDINNADDVYDAGANGKIVVFDVDSDGTDDNPLNLAAPGGVPLEWVGYARDTAETTAALTGVGATPVTKSLYLDILDIPNYQHDKPEGFVVLNATTREVVIINDDDFGIDSSDPGQMFNKRIDVDGDGFKENDHNVLYQVDANVSGEITSSTAYTYEAGLLVDEAPNRQRPGQAVFVDTYSMDVISSVAVGYLPDMLTFNADGSLLFVANEGEPSEDYSFDPVGSVSVIDTAGDIADIDLGDVTDVGFTDFNTGGTRSGEVPADFRILSTATIMPTLAEDVEPEYIAVIGNTAFVTLQENNGLAVVDGDTKTVTNLLSLGTKDGLADGNEFDASNRDSGVEIRKWPVKMMYQPDAIASFEVGGNGYVVTANEGDSRQRPSDDDVFADQDEGDIYLDEERVKDLTLDPTAFAGWENLQDDDELGRLKVTLLNGDTDGDGDYDELYAYGGRSFSIWDESGALVFDSGNDIALITAARLGAEFNGGDGRSDDKGAEPESVETGVIDGTPYLFLGLERTNGVMVYDLSDPTAPSFVQYIRPTEDVSPEGLKFVPADKSPIDGVPLLLVSHEVSDTFTVYHLDDLPLEDVDFTLNLIHAADAESGLEAVEDLPRFSAVVNALTGYPGDLLVTSGDNFIPGAYLAASADSAVGDALDRNGFGNRLARGSSSRAAFGGRPDVAALGLMGFQASCFGNHEFDLGTSAVEDIIAGDIRSGGEVRWSGTPFPYLSVNLDFSTDSNLSGLVVPGTELVKPDHPAGNFVGNSMSGTISSSVIIEVDGHPVGVIGATTPLLPTISSPGDVTVAPASATDYVALAEIIQTEANRLMDMGVNKIVLLSHMQQYTIEVDELAPRLEGVDIIVAGGSNAIFADSTDVLRAGDMANENTYPVWKESADSQHPVAIVNVDGNWRYVGRLMVGFDEDGVIVEDSVDEAVSGTYATDQAGVDRLGDDAKIDTDVQDLATTISSVLNDKDGSIYGHTTAYLEGRRSFVRTTETNLGNLTADANLYRARTYALANAATPPTISIKNGGGIRASIGAFTSGANPTPVPPLANASAMKESGDISQLDIENTLRFNNSLDIVTVTGAQLKEILEHGIAASGNGSTPGQFIHVSGVQFAYDLDQAVGSRISEIVITDHLTVTTGGDATTGVATTTIYDAAWLASFETDAFTLVTLNFIEGGGDGYPFDTFEADDSVFYNEVEVMDNTNEGFFNQGGEQWALADFLRQFFPNDSDAFATSQADTDLNGQRLIDETTATLSN